jgi:nitrate reductase NapE component
VGRQHLGQSAAAVTQRHWHAAYNRMQTQRAKVMSRNLLFAIVIIGVFTLLAMLLVGVFGEEYGNEARAFLRELARRVF